MREVAGDDRPRKRQNEENARDEIKQGGEIGRSSRSALLLVHRQHALVTRKPPKMFTEARISAMKPKSVRRSEPSSPTRGTDTDREQRADDDHRGNRVGHRHQRRVQRRRHRPDDVIADEDGQHENRSRKTKGSMAPPARHVGRRASHVRDLVGIGLRRDRQRAARLAAAACAFIDEAARACVESLRRCSFSSSVRQDRRFWKFGCTSAPSLVSKVALTISSSQSTASAPVFLSIEGLDEIEQVARIERRGGRGEPRRRR